MRLLRFPFATLRASAHRNDTKELSGLAPNFKAEHTLHFEASPIYLNEAKKIKGWV